MIVPLTLACLVALTNQFGFPRETLFALLLQEGGREGASSPNANGTYDHGPFQINDVNVASIARRHGMTESAARERLRDDGCFNASAAAELLAGHWKATGDIWVAIGYYHSKTERFASVYRDRTWDKVERLYKPAPARSGARQ
jgi:hypothetical protein